MVPERPFEAFDSVAKQVQPPNIRTPCAGIGKPEPLPGALAGWWSRRITEEHRLVYRPSEQGLLLAQMRYHS